MKPEERFMVTEQCTHAVRVFHGSQAQNLENSLHAIVAERAFNLFEKGRPGRGNHVSHWLQAEAGLLRPAITVLDNGHSMNFGLQLQNVTPEQISVCVQKNRAIIIVDRGVNPSPSGPTSSGIDNVLFLAAFPSEAKPESAIAYFKNGILTVKVQKNSSVSV